MYPPSDQAVKYGACVLTASSSASTDTPLQFVSSFVHFVTQWMSTVGASDESARNSSHVHDTGSSTFPPIVKLHASSGVCGVGPAERTGKSRVTYWPGGTRDASSTGCLRPRKPREIGDIVFRVTAGDGARQVFFRSAPLVDRIGKLEPWWDRTMRLLCRAGRCGRRLGRTL